MDAHEAEGLAAVRGMQDTYGTATGEWRDGRHRWQLNDYVLFYYNGDLRRGQILAFEQQPERDTYTIRSHKVGGGNEVVEVLDTAIMLY